MNIHEHPSDSSAPAIARVPRSKSQCVWGFKIIWSGIVPSGFMKHRCLFNKLHRQGRKKRSVRYIGSCDSGTVSTEPIRNKFGSMENDNGKGLQPALKVLGTGLIHQHLPRSRASQRPRSGVRAQAEVMNCVTWIEPTLVRTICLLIQAS